MEGEKDRRRDRRTDERTLPAEAGGPKILASSRDTPCFIVKDKNLNLIKTDAFLPFNPSW